MQCCECTFTLSQTSEFIVTAAVALGYPMTSSHNDLSIAILTHDDTLMLSWASQKVSAVGGDKKTTSAVYQYIPNMKRLNLSKYLIGAHYNMDRVVF